jgi:hypothetical protein
MRVIWTFAALCAAVTLAGPALAKNNSTGMRAMPPLYTGLAPVFRPQAGIGHRFVRGGAVQRVHAHRRHHRRGFDLGAVVYAAPVIYTVQDYAPAPDTVAVWRGSASGVCSSEAVAVMTGHGMDEVTITRC